jgi:predicted ATPase
MRNFAAQFLALAGKQGATVLVMVGHRLMGTSLLVTGGVAEGRAHHDRAIALYNPAEHLATRFGQDSGVATLSYRSWALWMLGYPEAALADAEHALKDAREIGHAPTLMFALIHTSVTYILCGNYGTANTLLGQVVALAEEKGTLFWKCGAILLQGCVLSLTGEGFNAIQMSTSGITGWRSTGSTMWLPLYLPPLAEAYGALGQFDNAWRCISEALIATETTKESWCEVEVHRTAGEIALLSPNPNTAKAEGYFERALAVARQQQAKSWELRAAISMARLWRAQGKRNEARELLAPVYGWFTEGFDTLDLKEAKALLGELGS